MISGLNLQNSQRAKLAPPNSSAQQIGKSNRPLKAPKPQSSANAQNSLIAGKSAALQSEKKGPHIQYQVKTGKPNSMSSHEMDSDRSSDLPPFYPYHNNAQLKCKRSFDAY